MAFAAWFVSAPMTAARLDMPLMAETESFRPTPAAVNLPMLAVISLKLYTVSSAYLFSSSRAAVTVWRFSPFAAVFARIV